MIFLCSRVLGDAPGIDLGCPGEPPGKDFARILGHSLRHFGRSWPSIFVPILCQVCPNSGSVVVLPSVSHPCCPAFSCRGCGLVQRVKSAAPMAGVFGTIYKAGPQFGRACPPLPSHRRPSCRPALRERRERHPILFFFTFFPSKI